MARGRNAKSTKPKTTLGGGHLLVLLKALLSAPQTVFEQPAERGTKKLADGIELVSLITAEIQLTARDLLVELPSGQHGVPVK